MPETRRRRTSAVATAVENWRAAQAQLATAVRRKVTAELLAEADPSTENLFTLHDAVRSEWAARTAETAAALAFRDTVGPRIKTADNPAKLRSLPR